MTLLCLREKNYCINFVILLLFNIKKLTMNINFSKYVKYILLDLILWTVNFIVIIHEKKV